MTTAAAIDRLVRHSTIVEFTVPSFRSDLARKEPEKNADPGRTNGDNYPKPSRDNYPKSKKGKIS